MHFCSSLFKNSLSCLLFTAIFTLAGCGPAGPKIASVEGLITLDGKPVPKVDILFVPQTVSGRTSVGQTKEDGTYKLIYSTEQIGALVDKHKVEVYYANPDDTIKQVGIPERYRGEQTVLSYDVKSGNNVINIELTSEKDK